MPENQSEVITISKIESKMFDNGGSQYKLTAGNKKFKFNDRLKAGGETVAFKQFKDMGIKVGSTVEVWYKSIQKDYQGTPYTDNMIASFREAKNAPQTQNPAPSKEISHQADKGEEFWEKKAYKQCLWNYWLKRYDPFAGAKTADGMLGEAEMTTVWQVFNQINKDADKRFATGWDKAVKTFADDEPLSEDLGAGIGSLPDNTITPEQIPF